MLDAGINAFENGRFLDRKNPRLQEENGVMSFSLKINPKDKATGRFKSRVNRDLVKAVIAAKRGKNLTQSEIAERMGIDKSALSRILNGQGNLTLKTIGDICWALELRPDIKFSKIQPDDPDRKN